ncbi:dTMP kinase [Candidatus Bathyarchaeota archaeon ex4484_205]|nr:MAG: dTMP kinase [Candidatus Bathyarchaeota archaeon ex4484_205]RLG69309.1 MAG: dTMP kinase [archaeon]
MTMNEGGRGRHISFEGIDGAGKTTQAVLLVERLRELKYRAVYTTEPTYRGIGAYLRKKIIHDDIIHPSLEALLFATDRIEHYYSEIEKLTSEGVWVISDRYVHSSYAYQGAILDLEWIKCINRYAPLPDVAFYLDIEPEKALLRRGEKRTRFEKREYLEKVREVYLELAKMGEVILINADREIFEIHREILEYLSNLNLIQV